MPRAPPSSGDSASSGSNSSVQLLLYGTGTQCCERGYSRECNQRPAAVFAEDGVLNRTTSNPEILLANQVLLAEAIKKAPTIYPELRDYNEVVYGNIGGAPDRGNLLDQPYAEDNTGFIGSGARPKREVLAQAKVTFFYSPGGACMLSSSLRVTLMFWKSAQLVKAIMAVAGCCRLRRSGTSGTSPKMAGLTLHATPPPTLCTKQ